MNQKFKETLIKECLKCSLPGADTIDFNVARVCFDEVLGSFECYSCNAVGPLMKDYFELKRDKNDEYFIGCVCPKCNTTMFKIDMVNWEDN